MFRPHILPLFWFEKGAKPSKEPPAVKEVTVTPKVGMWDKHKDRRFEAVVEAVVIAVCENK